jgi:hypothetical protein
MKISSHAVGLCGPPGDLVSLDERHHARQTVALPPLGHVKLAIPLLRLRPGRKQHFPLEIGRQTPRDDLDQVRLFRRKIPRLIAENPERSQRHRRTAHRHAHRGGIILRATPMRQNRCVFKHDGMTDERFKVRHRPA